MKKFFVALSIVGVFALTGCGKTVTSDGMDIEKRDFGEITEVKTKKTNNETVTCSMTQEESNVTMDQDIILYFKSNSLKSADIVINAVLDDDYLDFLDTFVDTLEEEFDDFEYGSNVKVKKTSKGAKVTYSMDEDDFEDQYGLATTKSAIVSELEDAGYDCD